MGLQASHIGITTRGMLKYFVEDKKGATRQTPLITCGFWRSYFSQCGTYSGKAMSSYGNSSQ